MSWYNLFQQKWDLIATVSNPSSLTEMFHSIVPRVNALLRILKCWRELTLKRHNSEVKDKFKKEEKKYNKGLLIKKYYGLNLCLLNQEKSLWDSWVLNDNLTVKIL